MADTFLAGTFDMNDGVTYRCVMSGFTPSVPVRTEDFKRHCRAGRDPDRFGGQRYVSDPGPVHGYTVQVAAATPTALETALDALDAALSPGENLYVQPNGSSLMVYAAIRGATRTDPAYQPDETGTGRVVAIVRYAIECEPGWTRTTGTAITPTVISAYPGFVDVEGVGGNMPAKTDLQATCAQALSKLFVAYASNRDDATNGLTNPIPSAFTVGAGDPANKADGWTYGAVSSSANTTMAVTDADPGERWVIAGEAGATNRGRYSSQALTGLAEGESVVGETTVRGTNSGCTISLILTAYDSVPAVIASKTYTITPAATDVRYLVRYLDLPAGTASVRLVRQVTGIDAGDSCDITWTNMSLKRVTLHGLQDYQGDATHAAKCRSGEAAKLTTMDGDLDPIGTAEDLDSATHEGWWAVIASLLQTDATASDTTYRAVSRVTGSGIAETADYPTPTTEASVASSAALECLHLGDVPIPSAGIPTDTPSGFGDAAVLVSQETQDGYAAVAAMGCYGQVVHVTTRQQLSSIAFALGQSGYGASVADVVVRAYDTATDTLGALIDSAQLEVPLGGGPTVEGGQFVNQTVVVPGYYAFLVTAIGTGLRVYRRNSDVLADSFAISAASWAAGTVCTELAADADFSLTTRPKKGYAVNAIIQASNTGGGSAFLDWVQLMPAEEFFLRSYHAFSANQGVRVDSDLGDVLLTDSSDNRGFSLVYRSASDRTLVIGDTGLRPGTTRIFACGGNSGTTAPGAITISGTYWDRYELPPGV